MDRIYREFARQQSKFFKVSFSPEYKTQLPNHIIADQTHPLHVTQKRRLAERKREGLWWHVTVGTDLSKSACVRAWARRRLRQAVLEELNGNGYDEHGMRKRNIAPQTTGKDMRGSLRLHVQAPLVPAKYEEVKADARKVIDILVEAVNDPLVNFDTVRQPVKMRPQRLPQRNGSKKGTTAP